RLLTTDHRQRQRIRGARTTMKLSRILLALALVLLLTGVAYVSQRPDAPATRMAAAAQKFLDSLTPEQKKKAQFDFDNAERTTCRSTTRWTTTRWSARRRRSSGPTRPTRCA